MKRYTRMTSLAGAMAAGAMLMGCSSDDNLDRFEFPNFPSIAMAGADEDRRADADLTGDALAYQAALIYETTLNFRDYDAIERPLTDEPNGRTDCALDGYVHHDRFTAPYSGSFGEGPVDAEAVTAYGCTVADTEYNAAGERAVVGKLTFFEDEIDCDGVDCTISYNSYVSPDFPYRVQYFGPAGAGQNERLRVELYGVTVDGPGEPIEVGGTARAVLERTQDLLVTNAIGLVSDAGVVSDQTVFTLKMDGGASGSFVRREIAGVNQLQLEGAIGSGSTRDDACVGGRFQVETVANLAVDAGNIVTGALALTSGTGDDAQEASLVFQPNGDVTVTDADGATDTLTRAALEALRTTCFQTVVAKR